MLLNGEDQSFISPFFCSVLLFYILILPTDKLNSHLNLTQKKTAFKKLVFSSVIISWTKLNQQNSKKIKAW